MPEQLVDVYNRLGDEIEKLYEHVEQISSESDLLGSTEAAELTGLHRQHLSDKVKRGTFPAPFARLKMGPIWKRSQIEAWIAAKQSAASVD